MRHRVAGRKLSRHTQHRELMFRNMLVSLLQYERIETTLAKGKELRGWADRIISLGKKGTLHARRRVFALLRNKEIVKKLFDEIAPKFKEREGGYTRVYRLGWRQGDGAPLSLVELVTYAPAKEKKSRVERAKEAIGKVTPRRKGKKEEVEGKKKGREKIEKAEGKEKKEKKVKKEEKEAPKKKEKAKKKSEPKGK